MQDKALLIERQPFTDYLERLGSLRAKADPERIEELLMALWASLKGVIKRRGLWEQPPSYLGIYGLASWAEADRAAPFLTAGQSEGRDGLELLMACYKYVFVDRYRYLSRQLKIRRHIEGLIYPIVRNFIHETQKKHDPFGFRVFVIVQSAVLESMKDGELVVLKGDPRVRNDTVLGFAEGASVEALAGESLAEIVRAWNDTLLPDLITGTGDARKRVVATLRMLLAALPAEEVGAFRFRELVEPLKNDARARWAALYDHSEGPTAIEGREAELLRFVRQIAPDNSFEAKDAYQKLVECIGKAVSRHEESPAVRRHLEKLWSFLRLHTALPREQLPSRRRLAQALHIPRNLMPRLFAILGNLAATCQRSVEGPPARAGNRSAARTGDPKKVVGLREHQAFRSGSFLSMLTRWTAETRRQAASDELELERHAGRKAEPGDLFVTPEVADQGVEWVVLERDPGDAPRLLVVPADLSPLVGSADVAAPAEAGGPLTLRCAFGVWIDTDDLDPKLRAAVVPRATLEQARRKRQQLEDGTLVGSEPEQEVDADPEYAQWAEDTLKPARSALARSTASEPEPSCGRSELDGTPGIRTAPRRIRLLSRRGTSLRLLAWAASVVFVVTLVLLATLEQQRRTLRQDYSRLRHEKELAEQEYRRKISNLEAMSSGGELDVVFNPPLVQLLPGDVRGPAKKVRLSSRTVFVVLLFATKISESGYRLEILGPQDEEIWSGIGPSDRLAELRVLVPTSRLSAGDYRLRLYTGGDGEGSELLGEYTLSIEIE